MRYEITTKFVTDRDLTEEEMHAILSTISLQVLEPADLNGEEIDVETGDVDTTFVFPYEPEWDDEEEEQTDRGEFGLDDDFNLGLANLEEAQNSTIGNDEQLKKARETIRHIIEKIERDYLVAFSAWVEAEDKADSDEEFDDTLQRKYDEGYNEALVPVIRALNQFAEEL
jgi:hypothetical protein